MMDDLSKNHSAFEAEQHSQSQDAYIVLGQSKDLFLESYKRLITLNSWAEYLLQGTFEPNVMEFFIEAQNDALIAHLLARQGMWRPSLQSLRSCIENVLVGHYYCDHSVELKQWEQGEHRIGFTALGTYFTGHPNFQRCRNPNLSSIEILKREYAVLSKAVHGSSKAFRMGDVNKIPNVYLPDNVLLAKWLVNQRNVLQGLNLFLIAFHREKLLGTAFPGLRKSLSFVFNAKLSAEIKAEYAVVITK